MTTRSDGTETVQVTPMRTLASSA